jgi:diguanylate cyclase (GGDEF)-like protein
MIQKVLDIIDKNFIKVDTLNGVRRILNIFHEDNMECFLAYENECLVGIVTKKELVGAHPNRIIADIMSDNYICVNCFSYVWEVKEIFDLDKNIEIILVEDENMIIGYIARAALYAEMGKHVDLLTGLNKKDYLFYNAYKLIRSGQNVVIVFIDLNNFGYIDKIYGHINGDIILINVAEVLKENTPSDSYLCRYAGDEFAILTPYSIEYSRVLAEKIINAINKHKFPNDIAVSASIGIAGYSKDSIRMEDISEVINKLVNISSLASTKAKQSANDPIIIGDTGIDAIA